MELGTLYGTFSAKIAEWTFSVSLILSVLLFVPQAVKIVRTQSAEGISLLTFLGFLLIQAMAAAHALIQEDRALVAGDLLSILACGAVVILAVYYRHYTPASRKKDHSMTTDLQTEVKRKSKSHSEIDLLENIIALMPGHVYWISRDGRYLGCNDQQAQSAGLKRRQDIVGKLNADLPWNYHVKALPEALDHINASVMERGETLIVEEPALLPNGVRKTFLSTKAPLRNPEGQVIGMVGISIDITERKDAEKAFALAMRQAEAANRVQTDFLTHMRQDIRTPMSGIVEAAARLQRTTNLSIVRQLGAEITASGEEFLGFMEELLGSAQAVSGSMPVLQQKFSLQTLIDRVVKLNRPKALMKQVLILTAYSNPIPNYLIGDPIRIYRIVLELVINALKVSERSTLEIVTSARADRDGKAVIQLSVEDMGPGVPEDQQAFLFTGLYQRPVPAYARDYQGADLAREHPGAGFGLFLIKKLVDDLQGEIYYEPGTLCKDQYGKPRGAKFVCLLPLRRALIPDNSGEHRTSRYWEWARSLNDEKVTA